MCPKHPHQRADDGIGTHVRFVRQESNSQKQLGELFADTGRGILKMQVDGQIGWLGSRSRISANSTGREITASAKIVVMPATERR